MLGYLSCLGVQCHVYYIYIRALQYTTLIFRFPSLCPLRQYLEQSLLSHYDRFPWKMVLKRSSMKLAGEDCSVHSLFRSPRRQSSLAQRIVSYGNWSWDRLYMFIIWSPRKQSSSSCYNSFTQKRVLKRLFIIWERLCSAHSFFRSLGRQNSYSWCDSVARTDFGLFSPWECGGLEGNEFVSFTLGGCGSL